MDKTLGSNNETNSTIHNIASLAEQRFRPPLLRRVSRSDPHLDEQNAARILSSAFDKSDNAKSLMPLNSTKSTSAVPTSVDNTTEPDITRNFSALNLGLLNTEDRSGIGSLRKASSFIHGTSFGLNKNQNSSFLNIQPSFCIGGNFTPVTNSVTTVTEATHSHQGGLSMSVQPTNKTVNSLKASDNMQHSASIGGLFSSSSSDSNTSNRGIMSNNSSDSLNSTTHKPLGIFGRGFFAKPLRSEEENYRYIMALER